MNKITSEWIDAYRRNRGPTGNDCALNEIFHVWMHLPGANASLLISKADQLLDEGAQWDGEQMLFHVAGGSIHSCTEPKSIDEVMLRYLHDRGVDLGPLREHAMECGGVTYQAEWFAVMDRAECAGRLQAATVEAPAPARVGRL
ncbi:hypothetical protein [Novilysobacter arseniciresistens]|uniref:hypothetical protein n=1 Tax=Novilysobacter arseniciresistens TaxID=1385522 RepID=UPI00126993F8|nr:hypothetical protein [Lysobacter arseniciresistens]